MVGLLAWLGAWLAAPSASYATASLVALGLASAMSAAAYRCRLELCAPAHRRSPASPKASRSSTALQSSHGSSCSLIEADTHLVSWERFDAQL